ncbi:hypothetical protein BJ508DRAFT_411622 [Ascobolus immersus RN42]|uniref:Uncharacterized protein n=1 Tax=Ascobolus immersus RN42 TaxID=1160509 RepID=A0A3N4IMV7_ASCIM|nr:hypothetical protein BJ508DRAFT_411622 [Ascobolus immersus RN42]
MAETEVSAPPAPPPALEAVPDSVRVQRLEFVIKQSKVLASIIGEKLEKKQKELREAAEKQKVRDEKKENAEVTPAASTATSTKPTRTTRRGKVEPTPSTPAPATTATTTGKRRGRPARAQPAKSQSTITSLIDKSTVDNVTQGATTTELLASAALEDNDGKLGATNLKSARQPALITGAVMKDYQLEGLDWLVSLYENGLNGILADEMGLGKTIQTISLLAFLREKGTYGPFMVVCPVTTLDNWINEISKFAPDMPKLKYHGTPQERTQMRADIVDKKVDASYPVIATTYEMVMKDRTYLQRIAWKYIIVDEGHRLKNLDCKLIRELKSYSSANRLLLTGTPLQNNLSELWSLLNFLLPDIFDDLDAFQEWFDFSALQNKEGHKEFLEKDKKTQIVSSLHAILRPFLLRRIKADVNLGLPPKREYVLYAPLTQEQRDLYQALLEKRGKEYVVEKIMEVKGISADNGTDTATETSTETEPELDASYFTNGKKRKMPREIRELSSPPNKLLRTSPGSSAPGTPSIPGTPTLGFGKLSLKGSSGKGGQMTFTLKPPASAKRKRKDINYREPTDREALKAMEEMESRQRLGSPLAGMEDEDEGEEELTEAEVLERTLKDATKLAGGKKWSNLTMQLRLACNHPYIFYQPWAVQNNTSPDPSDPSHHPDSRLITASGKMLLLDRLLPRLFAQNHKVIIFTQFVSILDILQDYAYLKDWPVCRIEGSTSQVERGEIIKLFNEDPEHKLFIVTTRAGGLGINLTAADTVILFDSDWNPQMDLQAMDRAHRIGQTRPVLVFRLATANTIEQRMLDKAESKRRLEKLVIKKGEFKSLIEAKTRDGPTEEELKEILEEGLGEAAVLREGEEVLGEEEMRVLLDRSEEAYARAAKGEGGRCFKAVEVE